VDPYAAAPPEPPIDPLGMAFPPTEAYGAMEALSVGPQLPEGYKPAKRPNKKLVLADKEDLLAEHGDRLRETEAMDRTLAPIRADLDVGHFEIDEDDIISGEKEVFPLQLLRAEHEFNCGMLAGMDRYIEHSSREKIDSEEVLAIEDACYYALQCFDRQYARQTGSARKRAMPNILQRRGGLVSLLTVNPDDAQCGASYSLLDPATVFPIWEGARGLSDVFRVYQDTGGNVIGAWADPTGGVERSVERITRKLGGGRAARNQLVDVVEYWNRDWVTVLVNDEPILTRQHGMARVPFIVTLGGFELPQGMSSGRREYWNDTTLEPGWHRGQESSPEVAAYWRPWGYQHLQTHAIMEAVAGRVLYDFRRSGNRPMLYEFDQYSAAKDRADISQMEGVVNRIPLGNKLSMLPTGPDGPTLAMLDGFLQANANQGLWTQIRTGQIPPQTPTAALGTMFDLGGGDRSALSDAIAMHERDVLEFFLELVRDWGAVMGKPGNRGVLEIPAQQPQYGSPVHLLTPEMIERAGVYLDLSLFHWKPDPALAQYLSTMLASGMSSPETAIRKARFVPDPAREMSRIEDAMLRQTPEVATMLKMSELEKQRDQAIAEGDWDSADKANVVVMQLEHMRNMQMMAGSAPPPGGAAGGGMGMGMGAGAMGGGGGGGGTVGAAQVSQQGLSLPELGFGEGHGGGRPVGTTQTRGPIDNTLISAPQR
jgi:hypothetical protein